MCGSKRGREWMLVLAWLVCASGGWAVVISEVMYHPQTDETHNEFVEICNEKAYRIDLGGWQFTDGIHYTFAPGTLLEPLGYLVIARDPATLQGRGVANVVGPCTGALNNSSDHIILRDPAGGIMAEVDYEDDGKWPVAADGAGHSLSKANPRGAPNDPDNWAASPLPGGTPGRENGLGDGAAELELIRVGDIWRYFKGRTEASTPIDAWRQISFDDSSWTTGPTGIGYGDDDDATILNDMRGGYVSVFCRKSFDLADPAAIDQIFLTVNYDDGIVAYLNGAEVARASISSATAVRYNTYARTHETGQAQVFDLTPWRNRLVAGRNVLAVQVHNNSPNDDDLSFIPSLRGRTLGHGRVAPSPILLNEALSRTSGTQFIELYNRSDAALDLGGWCLSNDPDNLRRFQIPSNTWIAGHGHAAFSSGQLRFALNPLGDRVLLTSPTANIVFDAHAFELGPPNASEGRWPDGAGEWLYMTPTMGTANIAALTSAVVINEIMYHPPSDLEADEYLELYNRSGAPVSLAGWSFTRGVSYDFPSTAVIGPGQYLVVARDRPRLMARYGLPPSMVLGNFTGQLSDVGEKVRLRDAGGNPADEVTYWEGGRWSEYADGYGSSLERIDPRQPGAPYQAWAASNETGKAQWQSLSYTGIVAVPADTHEHEVHFLLLGGGEALIDDVRLTGPSADEHIVNGTFEGGGGGWIVMGNHMHSQVVEDPWQSGNHCLRLVATGSGDTGANHVEYNADVPLTNGARYTLSFRAKWQWGNRNLVARFWGNQLAETHALATPANTGTPGTTNSVYLANLGPVASEVRHEPPVPRAADPVVVRARVQDSDGVSTVVLWYQGDYDLAPSRVLMNDTGAGVDVKAGDGIYSAAIPPHATSQTVAFHLAAVDRRGATSTWPSDISRPALYRVQDDRWLSSFPTYRVVMTRADMDYLFARPHLSNDLVNCTFVFDERDVHYNCGVRYTGSAASRRGALFRGYKIIFNSDEKLYGIRSETRFDDRHNAGYREHLAYDLLRYMKQPTCPLEWVEARVNGSNEGITEDVQSPGKDYLDLFARGDDDGHLYKLTVRNEFTANDDLDLNESITVGAGWTYLGADKDAYRWHYRPRTRRQEDDFTSLIATVDVISRIPATTTEAEVAGLIDVQNWLRVFCVRLVNGDWDSFGRTNKNGYVYASHRTGRVRSFPWDCELAFTSAYTTMSVYGALPQIRQLQTFRSFHHDYLNAMHEYTAKYFNPAFLFPWVDYYWNLVGGYQIAPMKAFVTARYAYVMNELAPYVLPNTPIDIYETDPVTVNGTTASLTGSAPINVSWIRFNGIEYRPGWSDATHWYVTLNVPPGPPTVTLEFLDYDKNLVGTASITVVTPTNRPAFVVSQGKVAVPEGGTARFGVKLNWIPSTPVTARVARSAGDGHIVVEEPATVTFDSQNWNTYQYVTLSGAPDPDTVDGVAMIRIAVTSGPQIPFAEVLAVEREPANVRRWREYGQP